MLKQIWEDSSNPEGKVKSIVELFCENQEEQSIQEIYELVQPSNLGLSINNVKKPSKQKFVIVNTRTIRYNGSKCTLMEFKDFSNSKFL